MGGRQSVKAKKPGVKKRAKASQGSSGTKPVAVASDVVIEEANAAFDSCRADEGLATLRRRDTVLRGEYVHVLVVVVKLVGGLLRAKRRGV